MDQDIKVLKLITGETVIADIKYDNQKKHVTLNYPLLFNLEYKQSGAVSMVATKWMESPLTSHKIKTYHVVVTTTPTKTMHQLYIESVQEMIEFDNTPSTPKIDPQNPDWDKLVDYLDELDDYDDKDDKEYIIH